MPVACHRGDVHESDAVTAIGLSRDGVEQVSGTIEVHRQGGFGMVVRIGKAVILIIFKLLVINPVKETCCSPFMPILRITFRPYLTKIEIQVIILLIVPIILARNIEIGIANWTIFLPIKIIGPL